MKPCSEKGFLLRSSATATRDSQRLILLCLLACLAAVILICHLAWLLLQTRREARLQEKQLNRARYMLEIEETLFGAARNPGQIPLALQKAAAALTAKSAFLLVSGNFQEKQAYLWPEPESVPESRALREEFESYFLTLASRLKKEDSLLSYSREELIREYGLPESLNISSLMLVPVVDADDVPTGVLAAAGMERRWDSAELLECVRLSFSMAVNNIEAFRAVREMGTVDHLTGLFNSNSFQRAMELHQKTSGEESLACVYVDADGLHELNNQGGHIFGDKMLQAVSGALSREFGAEDTYRIGGDEFVSFCLGLNERQMKVRVQSLERELSTSGYHVSTGVEWRRNVPLIRDLVKAAEAKMYEAKRAYYESLDTAEKGRCVNQELEAVLQEKRDLEVFRAALSTKYLGVYIVDLRLDAMRSIYIPPYFKEAIHEAGGSFSKAIQLYGKRKVQPENRNEFFWLTDYQLLERRLDRGEEPELRYQRNDGAAVLLKIRRSPEYNWQRKECVWSFELPEQNGAAALPAE